MTRGFGSAYDSILFFTKSETAIWNQLILDHSPEYIERYYTQTEEGTGRKYQLTSLLSPATDRPNLTYKFHGHLRVWRYTKDRISELENQGRVVVPKDGGMPREKRYLDEMKGVALQDLWTDVFAVNAMAIEREDYPTQKPEALLERIVLSSSNPSDIVLDGFIGSGTTVAVAQKLGRRWIGCDINKGAIQTTAKRMQTVIQEQLEESKKGTLSLGLSAESGEEKPPAGPAQTSFSIWRVNDYDLAIQHNEAVNLACEHIGIERNRTDAYFDGTLGKALVKIIPFGHPLTPLDLEELKRELEARPDEDRQITLVCLGMELAAKVWIEEWSRLRKGKDAVNKINVIELRTDPKYGKFMKHEPAKAKIKIGRKKDKITVEIEDFISPTIVERLQQQAGLLKPKIDDWRAMVDCVMIDTAYDEKIFNVVFSDVPEKKTDLVQASYELPAGNGETTIAVKIIDMLGEEVLISRQV